MSELHVIIGAGPVGSALAERLAVRGDRVRLITRSGRDLGVEGVEPIAADASDPDAVAARASGAAVIYNCANPGSYTEWERAWPPLAASLLTAAERSGAVLATASNLYGYGPVTGAMTRSTPLRPSDHKGALRARMWADARAAHEAGRVRVTEVRSSDYIGPTVTTSGGLLAMYAEKTLAGRTARVFADPDQPHTWTAIDDVAALLAEVGGSERAWGSAWITPSNPPRTVRQVLAELAADAGTGAPRLSLVPRWVLKAGGLVVPLLREANGILYQFDGPFIADGTETTETFGLTPMDWRTVIERTAVAWTARLG